MRLAIVDPDDNVLIAWPTVESAHGDIADQVAAQLAPRAWQKGKRRRIAASIRAHLLDLQTQVVRL